MGIIAGQTAHASLEKNYQPDLSLTVVASGTTAMLTYYNGYKPPTGTGTDYNLPNYGVGDLIFATVSTTDTISVTGSTDGTNYEAAFNTSGADPVIFSMATGLPAASQNLASGTYRIPYRFHQRYRTFQFTKSGTNAVASLAVTKIVVSP